MPFAYSGKQRRLARFFRHNDGRALLLPIDDGLISGPRRHLCDLHTFFTRIEPCLPDGLLLFPGVLRRYFPLLHGLAAIVNLTPSTTLISHTRKIFCTDVEAAVAAGADMVAVHVNMTSRHEPEMLRTLGDVVRRADTLGIPVLAIMYPRRETNGGDDNYGHLRDTRPDRYLTLVTHAARVAMELGADVIKTQYTGSPDSFARVVHAVHPVPVLTAGGSLSSEQEVLSCARGALAGGARGVSFGRNVFQRDDPVHFLRLLQATLHDDVPAPTTPSSRGLPSPTTTSGPPLV